MALRTKWRCSLLASFAPQPYPEANPALRTVRRSNCLAAPMRGISAVHQGHTAGSGAPGPNRSPAVLHPALIRTPLRVHPL